MKITTVKNFIMWAGDADGQQYSSTLWGKGAGRNWHFVKVETDEGVYGWGEASLVNQTQTIAQAVDMLAATIIGHAPGNIERHWQVMYLHNRYRGGVVINSALSAIDQALWDIKGKVLGVPVYELLGGALRGRLRVYAGAGDAEAALERVQQGFTGVKTGGWHTDDNVEEKDIAPSLRDNIAAIRDAVGSSVDIMIDNHGRSRPHLAIRQIRSIEDLDVLFFEEPVPPENPESLALVRQAGLRTQIAAGERSFNRWGFRDLIERQLVDVIQPDICHCGGISEMKRIAAMAEMYSIQVAPHNPKGPIATAANLQVCATIPNFLILEHVHPTPIFDEIQVAPMKMTNGFYTPPKTPGIGIDLREEVILANPPRFRPVVQAFYADGSPAHP